MVNPVAPPFKDFYQILQLQPDADSGLVDQAYWYLARVLSHTEGYSARAKLDDLNEAYSVLRSPALREAYDKIRDGILGAGAPPTLPRSAAPRPPLPVMARQHPRPSEDPAEQPAPTDPRFTLGSLLPRLPRLTLKLGRRQRAPLDQPAVAIAGHDLDKLLKSTEAARLRWRASAEPGAPYEDGEGSPAEHIAS